MNAGRAAVTVTEALKSRLSVRAFLPEPVPLELLRTILETAARAPSGGNLQPWHIAVLSGAKLAGLVAAVAARLPDFPKGDSAEYPIYPPGLTAPYTGRRLKVAEDMYALLGIERHDRAARAAWSAENFKFFGAPVGLLCFVDRQMGAPQFSDLGMFLQSVMLLLREAGYDSCPQEAWAIFAATVYAQLEIPEHLMLFCGMAIGKRDPGAPVNALATERASPAEFASFHGFEGG